MGPEGERLLVMSTGNSETGTDFAQMQVARS